MCSSFIGRHPAPPQEEEVAPSLSHFSLVGSSPPAPGERGAGRRGVGPAWGAMTCSSPRCRTARMRGSPSSTPTPAPPRCAPAPPPRQAAEASLPRGGKPAGQQGGGGWGQGGGLGRGGLPACLLGERGNEGADSLALALSRQLSPVSCRRRPGPGPAEQDGAWPSGLPRPGPSPPPGGEARRRASRPLSPAPTRRRRRPRRPPHGALPSGQPGADRVGGGGRGLLLSHPPHFLPPRPRPRSRFRSRWTPPPCGARR